jgi:hypothetical protein
LGEQAWDAQCEAADEWEESGTEGWNVHEVVA